MSSADETVVELSKKKMLLLLLASCVFVALGVWLVSLDEASLQVQSRFRNSVLVHGLGLVAVAFFGLCGGVGIKKLFSKKPGLVFNSSGIVDNSSGVSAGLIPWPEIVGVELFELQKQELLVIKVTDPRKFIDRGGLVRRALNNANYKMCGSPIVISANALRMNFAGLLALFSQYQRKYGRA